MSLHACVRARARVTLQVHHRGSLCADAEVLTAFLAGMHGFSVSADPPLPSRPHDHVHHRKTRRDMTEATEQANDRRDVQLRGPKYPYLNILVHFVISAMLIKHSKLNMDVNLI